MPKAILDFRSPLAWRPAAPEGGGYVHTRESSIPLVANIREQQTTPEIIAQKLLKDNNKISQEGE
jgi:hypothetical protein